MKASYDYYSKIRDSLGYNDSKVAALSGVSRSTFTDWKSSRSIPKSDKLSKIATVLGCSVIDMMADAIGDPGLVRDPKTTHPVIYDIYLKDKAERQKSFEQIDSRDRFLERMDIYCRALSDDDRELLISIAKIMHEKANKKHQIDYLIQKDGREYTVETMKEGK